MTCTIEASTQACQSGCAEANRLRDALRRIDHELRIPAAEYVPAIPAVWEIIDAALQDRADG